MFLIRSETGLQWMAQPVALTLRLAADRPAGRRTPGEPMHWRRRLAALFVVLALAGCTQGTRGQPGTPYAPHSPEDNGIMPERGGWGWGQRYVGGARCATGAPLRAGEERATAAH